MPARIDFSEWLVALGREYLSTFISQGGAAVKFLVPPPGASVAPHLAAVREAAARLGYVEASIDAARVRVHLADQFFFAVARSVDWDDLTSRVVRRILQKAGYSHDQKGTGTLCEQIAEQNGVDPSLVLMDMRRGITDEVYRQHQLSKDFRLAMTRLCLDYCTAEASNRAGTRAVLAWLTGRDPSITALKPFQIFNRISRTNARHFLESLTQWVQIAGLPGVAVTLDISRLQIGRNPRDAAVYYTKAAVLDAFELLRQSIDGIDRHTGLLLVVGCDPEFPEETNPRGVHAYGALRARIFDEVRDRSLVNPMSSLLRLSEGGQ